MTQFCAKPVETSGGSHPLETSSMLRSLHNVYQESVVLIKASRCQVSIVLRVKPDEFASRSEAIQIERVELFTAPYDLHSTVCFLNFIRQETKQANEIDRVKWHVIDYMHVSKSRNALKHSIAEIISLARRRRRLVTVLPTARNADRCNS